MSMELKGMLHLVFYHLIYLCLYVGCELFIEKDKFSAKELAKNLGLVLLGVSESTFYIFLCWIFG